MKILKGVFGAALGTILLAGSAGAVPVTITFEGFNNATHTSPINRSGYLIGNVAGDEQHFHEINSTQFGVVSNGTGVLHNDRDTRIFVELASLQDFSLTSVDFSRAGNVSGAIAFTIQGFNNGVSTGIIPSASGAGYLTVLGASLGRVDRLIFDSTGGGSLAGFNLDNLALNDDPPAAAPEVDASAAAVPLTLTCFLMTLLWDRRKRSAVAL